MRTKGLGWWLLGVSAVFLVGCGGGEDSLPATRSVVLQHHAYDPQVAFDAAGNGAAVWSQFDGLRKNVWANRYNASTAAWSAPVLIETNNGGDADVPQLALDSAGNTLVVWEQSDSTRRNIWVNRYTAASQSWGTAQLLEADDVSFANAPQIALDASGNGMVVWEQSDGTRKSIWARRYNVVSGQWEIARVIEVSIEDANAPQITAADANGNFVAVWRGYDGVDHKRYNLWANRYVAGIGWGSAALISNNTTDPAAILDALVSKNADTPHVAMDAAGNALAVWAQDNSIYANRYTVGAGWGAAQLIESDVNWTAAAPRIAMAANGRAYAVWEQSADGVLGDTTPPFKNIMANRYLPGPGWQSATLIETNTGHAQAPQVAVNGVGNATVVWRQWDVTHYSVWSNRNISGQWGAAALIETDNSGDAVNPQVAVDMTGNALAVWSQSNGTRSSIRANRYTFDGTWNTALILDSAQ